MSTDSATFLITVRHVVDGYYRPPNKRVSGRAQEIVLQAYPLVSFGRVPDEGVQVLSGLDWVFDPDENDLAVAKIATPNYVARTIDYKSLISSKPSPSDYLAGHPVFFAGFPSFAPAQQDAEVPRKHVVCRQGILAVSGGAAITVEGWLGNDYGLIDGYAVSGFSGAPLFASPLSQMNYSDGFSRQAVPSSLLGMICGHFDVRDGTVHHSGMSYYVQKSAIVRTIKTML